MNSPERVPPATHKPFAGYLWGLLATLTCPCHLPVLAIVLAGTTVSRSQKIRSKASRQASNMVKASWARSQAVTSPSPNRDN